MTGTEIIIVGGVAVGAAFVTDELMPQPRDPEDSPSGRVPTGGSTLGDVVASATGGTPVASKPKVLVQLAKATGRSFDETVQASSVYVPSNTGSPLGWIGAGLNGDISPGSVDGAFQAKADLATGYCQAAWDKLESVGRIEAAKKLNEYLDLSPPLTGSEDFHTIVDRCAAGATTKLAKQGANALLDGVPVIGGVLGTVVGGLVGAYLGSKLTDFIDSSWDDCKSWFENRYSDLSDAASWVGNTAEDAAASVYNNTLGAIF